MNFVGRLSNEWWSPDIADMFSRGARLAEGIRRKQSVKLLIQTFRFLSIEERGLRIRLHRDIRRTSEHIAADSGAEQVSSSDCRSEIVASRNSSDMTQRLREVSKKSSGLRIDLFRKQS
jgi:uncharacterized protein YdaU (DUF1376 family)